MYGRHDRLAARRERPQRPHQRQRRRGVEPARRLVHQEERRPRDELDADGESLSLAAADPAPRGSTDELVADVSEAELVEDGVARLRPLGVGAAPGHAKVRRELYRLERGERGEHHVILKHDAHQPLTNLGPLAVDQEVSGHVRLVDEPGDDGQEAGLAAAAGSHQRRDRAGEEGRGAAVDDSLRGAIALGVSHDGRVPQVHQVDADPPEGCEGRRGIL